jgi:hypothetical protein
MASSLMAAIGVKEDSYFKFKLVCSVGSGSSYTYCSLEMKSVFLFNIWKR